MIANILTKEQQSAGFYLEQDDHTVYLMKSGQVEPLALFNATSVTIETLQWQAEQYLQAEKCGVSYEKSSSL